tara:strand:+ start:2162 stop:2269 length:108 start_codon:yes stop_codon:yes gene_type:complete
MNDKYKQATLFEWGLKIEGQTTLLDFYPKLFEVKE